MNNQGESKRPEYFYDRKWVTCKMCQLEFPVHTKSSKIYCYPCEKKIWKQNNKK